MGELAMSPSSDVSVWTIVKQRWFDIAAGLTILVLAFGLYRSAIEAQEARGEIARLTSRIDAVRAENQILAAEAAYLGNPRRVEDLAGAKLGMKPARIDQHPATIAEVGQ
jgi:cell division protein FtsL